MRVGYINTTEIFSYMSAPGSALALELEAVATAIVLPDARTSLGKQVFPDEHGRWPANPPEDGNPPHRRLGNLQMAIQVRPAELDVAGLLVVPLVAEVYNEGFRYDARLLERGYKFMDTGLSGDRYSYRLSAGEEGL